jgi:hypothetical protein
MIKRMDNVGIVVDDLKAAIALLSNLLWSWRARRPSRGSGWTAASGLDGVRSDIAMLKTPEGHSRLEHFGIAQPRSSTNALESPLALRRGGEQLAHLLSRSLVWRWQIVCGAMLGRVTRTVSDSLAADPKCSCALRSRRLKTIPNPEFWSHAQR